MLRAGARILEGFCQNLESSLGGLLCRVPAWLSSGREGVQSVPTPQDLQPRTLGEAGVWFASGLSALVRPSLFTAASLSGLREVSARRVGSW